MNRSEIPLEELFADPAIAQVQISPDGAKLAYIAPLDGVKNVFVQDLKTGEPHPVTHDRGRGIPYLGWLYNGDIVYIQDRDGDENWRLYRVRPEGGEPLLLTPGEGVQARPVRISPEHPNEILVALNDRDPRFHDLYRVNVTTGERVRILENPGFVDILADEHHRPRVAYRQTEEGGGELLVFNEGAWEPLLSWGLEDDITTRPVTVRGGFLYLFSSIGRNTAALVRVNLKTGDEALLAEDPDYDLANLTRGGNTLLFHPRKTAPEAIGVMRDRLSWIVLDESLKPDFARLQTEIEGDFYIASRDLEDRVWVVYETDDDQPGRYWLYDRGQKTLTLLGEAYPWLKQYRLAKTRPIRYTARDGRVIEGYLTLPPEKEARNLPAVILPHGGPWWRDAWGFDPWAQWLANRGFAVLQPNFRGSTGYGKDHLNAGNKEWGGKMQDDLSDGVRWLIEIGIADPNRIAIMGGSYGGYATLAGLAFTPELYAAGVDLVGPSNIVTLIESVPPYWKPMLATFHRRVGHPERDRELLIQRSPLFAADRIRAPLLIGQGKNDPRVKREESLQIVDALKKQGKPVEYVEYPDEGHGFMKFENRLDFFRKADAFLKRHVLGV